MSEKKNLSEAQLKTLWLISQGHQTVAAIREKTNAPVTTVWGMLERLEARELVKVTRPGKPKPISVALTAKGKRALQQAAPV